MTDTLVRDPARGDVLAPRRRRGPLARFSLAHGLMALSGLLAFVLIATVLSEKGDTVVVAVAARDVPAGTVITPEMVDTTELSTDSPLASSLLRAEQVRSGSWVTARPLREGEALRPSDLVEAGDHTTQRLMSVPVSRDHAVGGALSVGDRVDVIDVSEGEARWVVRDAQVVRVASSSSSGGIARDATREYYVVLEVDAPEALALAEALSDGKVEVIRSTGAEPIPDEPSGDEEPN